MANALQQSMSLVLNGTSALSTFDSFRGRPALAKGFNQSSMFGPGDMGSPLRPGAATMLSQVLPGVGMNNLMQTYSNNANGNYRNGSVPIASAGTGTMAGSVAGAESSTKGPTTSGAGFLGGVWGPSGYSVPGPGPGRSDTSGGSGPPGAVQLQSATSTSLPSIPESGDVSQSVTGDQNSVVAGGAVSSPTDTLSGLSPDTVGSETPSVTKPLLDNSYLYSAAGDTNNRSSFMTANPMMVGQRFDHSAAATLRFDTNSSSSSFRHGMPSILRSVLKQEGIEYENDFYWMSRFNQERARCPDSLERSLCHSLQHSLQLRNGPHGVNMAQSTLPDDSTLGLGFGSNVLNALESSNFTFASPKASMFARQLPGARQSTLRQTVPGDQALPSPYVQEGGGGMSTAGGTREVSEQESV